MFGALGIEGIFELGSAVVAIILFSLSMLAYHRYGQRKILYIASAFGLFFLGVVIEEIGVLLIGSENIFEIISAGIDIGAFAILFKAVVKDALKGITEIEFK
jgi:hypothetical protein